MYTSKSQGSTICACPYPTSSSPPIHPSIHLLPRRRRRRRRRGALIILILVTPSPSGPPRLGPEISSYFFSAAEESKGGRRGPCGFLHGYVAVVLMTVARPEEDADSRPSKTKIGRE